MRELICLVGLSGSGKSTVGKYLERKGYYYCSPGSYLKHISKEIENRFDYKYKYNDLIMSVEKVYEKGFNQFVSKVLQQIKNEKVVLDSLININNLEDIFDLYDKVFILAVSAPLNNRIERVS
ncbi:MAG: AAA family ATPase, partial [Bacillota bacterium]|nr:AAA family ATPase [Bacillota bacterium]